MVGLGGRTHNWIKEFLFDKFVRIGTVLSRRYMVDNGTPQGSVISPILFSIMINDVFSQVQKDVGRSLCADDGALWKRRRNVKHVMAKIQEAVNVVETWSYSWGFTFSLNLYY